MPFRLGSRHGSRERERWAGGMGCDRTERMQGVMEHLSACRGRSVCDIGAANMVNITALT